MLYDQYVMERLVKVSLERKCYPEPEFKFESQV